MHSILIVEDDFYIRDIYSHTLIQAGYDTYIASDGNEALVKLEEHTYDLILLDIMLPKRSGLDVLRIICSNPGRYQKVPVFMMTNSGQEALIQEAFSIGASGYFLKAQLTPQNILSEINAYFADQDRLKDSVIS